MHALVPTACTLSVHLTNECYKTEIHDTRVLIPLISVILGLRLSCFCPCHALCTASSKRLAVSRNYEHPCPQIPSERSQLFRRRIVSHGNDPTPDSRSENSRSGNPRVENYRASFVRGESHPSKVRIGSHRFPLMDFPDSCYMSRFGSRLAGSAPQTTRGLLERPPEEGGEEGGPTMRPLESHISSHLKVTIDWDLYRSAPLRFREHNLI